MARSSQPSPSKSPVARAEAKASKVSASLSPQKSSWSQISVVPVPHAPGAGVEDVHGAGVGGVVAYVLTGDADGHIGIAVAVAGSGEPEGMVGRRGMQGKGRNHQAQEDEQKTGEQPLAEHTTPPRQPAPRSGKQVVVVGTVVTMLPAVL